MNKATKTGLLMAGFFVLLGIAGRFDYEEEVISHMGEAAYRAVVDKVGERASDRTIIREYKAHKEYYDSLTMGER